MKVYVLETGCYEDRRVSGIYATPEAAMAAWQPIASEISWQQAKDYFRSRAYTWFQDDGAVGDPLRWVFGAWSDDAADITEWDVAE